MRRLVLVSLLLLAISGTATADETWTFNADTNLFGQNGLVIRIDEVGFPWFEFHSYPESGKYRFNATREQGDLSWTNINSPALYFCPTTTMSINDSWAFLPTDTGEATTATVKAFESVTVGAGTFNAYRVEITLDSNPSIKDAVFWFVDGVGPVRQEYYDSTQPSNPFDLRSDLASYSLVGGSGYLPAAVGNTWNFVDVSVANESASFGKVKALFTN